MVTKEEFIKMQDHSVLGPKATDSEVRRFIKECKEYGFAAIYVNPCDVKLAAEQLAGTGVNIGTVIGFPQGVNRTEIKIAEGHKAIEDGATDLDFVINIARMKSGQRDYVQKELNDFVKAMKEYDPKVVIKVIIETCFLDHDQKVEACKIVAESGADYIKTSTGTGPAGCRIGDIRLMRKICGDKVKIKAAAQITFVEQALAVIDAGATRIGENTAVEMLKDFDKQLWE
jgi:deoxyribose-phosphate aldolase